MKKSKIFAILTALLAFAGLDSAKGSVIAFPNDGISHQVDLVRHFTTNGTLITTASATYSGGASQWSHNAAGNAINGLLSSAPWRFSSTEDDRPTAQGVLVTDLGSLYDINRVRTLWNGDVGTYSIRVSADGNIWTEVVATKSQTNNGNHIDTFSSVSARYIEVTATGLVTAQAGLNEIFAYADANSPSPRPDAGFDLGYFVNSTQASVRLSGYWRNDPPDGNQLLGGNALTLQPELVADGGRESIAVIDLGQAFELNQINLRYAVGNPQSWSAGGKIEISMTDDAVYDETILDISTSLGNRTEVFDPQLARYIRITAYESTTAGRSALESVEIYAIPEPATAMLFIVSLAGLFLHRLRRKG